MTPTRTRTASVAVAASIALLVASLAGTTAATASEHAPERPTVLDRAAETEIRSTLARYDVHEEVADRLVAELRTGRTWDNVSGADPVSTETRTAGDLSETVYRFADGSISVDQVSTPQRESSSQFSTMSVSSCRLTVSNSYQKSYQNCFISRNDVVARVSFRADYTTFRGAARIDGNPRSFSRTYYLANPGRATYTKRTNATSALPARIRYNWSVNCAAGLPCGSYNAHLEFKVNLNGTVSSGYRL